MYGFPTACTLRQSRVLSIVFSRKRVSISETKFIDGYFYLARVGRKGCKPSGFIPIL